MKEGVFEAQLFTDVSVNHPQAEAIGYLQREGIASGYAAGTFEPQASINRAEFTRITNRAVAAAGPEQGKLCVAFERQGGRAQLFTDVPPGSWFEEDVCVARQRGVVNGYPDGSFKPASNITFAETAVVLARAFRLPLTADQASWYAPAVAALAERHAIPETIEGYDRPITRGEMAEMIWRLRAGVANRPSLEVASLEHGAANVEGEILELLNAERAKVSLPPLAMHPLLSRAAQSHAHDMEERDLYSHTGSDGRGPEDRIRDTSYLNVDIKTCNCRSWQYRYGENLLQGPFSPPDAVKIWMTSQIHRENILSPVFRDIGIAVQDESWVLVFGAIILQ